MALNRLERGLGTSSWSEKHLDVRPVKFSELPASCSWQRSAAWNFLGWRQHFLLHGGGHFRIKKNSDCPMAAGFCTDAERLIGDISILTGTCTFEVMHRDG